MGRFRYTILSGRVVSCSSHALTTVKEAAEYEAYDQRFAAFSTIFLMFGSNVSAATFDEWLAQFRLDALKRYFKEVLMQLLGRQFLLKGLLSWTASSLNLR